MLRAWPRLFLTGNHQSLPVSSLSDKLSGYIGVLGTCGIILIRLWYLMLAMPLIMAGDDKTGRDSNKVMLPEVKKSSVDEREIINGSLEEGYEIFIKRMVALLCYISHT